jgi:hypothetical protein
MTSHKWIGLGGSERNSGRVQPEKALTKAKNVNGTREVEK